MTWEELSNLQFYHMKMEIIKSWKVLADLLKIVITPAIGFVTVSGTQQLRAPRIEDRSPGFKSQPPTFIICNLGQTTQIPFASGSLSVKWE